MKNREQSENMEAELKAMLSDQKNLHIRLEKLENEWKETTKRYFDQKAEISNKLKEIDIERAIIMRTMRTAKP